MAELKLTTKNGRSCGGYYIFAQICSAEQNRICCEEEIVKNGDAGFKGGEIIQTKLQTCTDFIASHIEEDLTIKLEGWNELTVSQTISSNIIPMYTFRPQSFTASVMADLCQDINRVYSFSMCLNGIFP